MLVVVDANELFSALISRTKTLDIFLDKRVDIVSPKFILKEFEKHSKEIAKKSGSSEKDLEAFLFLLKPKIKFFKTEYFKEFLIEAKKISPDPDDVEYLALAIKLNCPLWSEDKSLREQTKVTVVSTSELLTKLEL